jgi:outer membrane protein assembly factor BamB
MRQIQICGLLALMLHVGMAQAQYDATFVYPLIPPPFDPVLNPDGPTLWGKWGNDLRNSHYNPYAQGPTNPRVLWVLPGGLLDEPLIRIEGYLLFPAHPLSNPRYTRYTWVDSWLGLELEPPFPTFPYWGQAVTPIVFNTTVLVRTSDGTFLGAFTDWPVIAMSGGQYDLLIVSPNPENVFRIPRGDPPRPPLRWVGNLGIPAYRSGLSAYTDGLSGYLILNDNLGNVRPVMMFWVLVVEANTETAVPYLFVDQPVLSLGAVYSVTGSQSYADIWVSTHHDGSIAGFTSRTTSRLLVDVQTPLFILELIRPGAPAVRWGVTLSDLSIMEPPDSSPIFSDTCDRPAVMSTDNQTVFLCATNYGRVYAVDALNTTKLWVAELGQPIMAGPSIGPDPINGNEETLYVVTRTGANRSMLVAIRAADGTVKWQRALGTVSRCTPTIDRNGRLFIGDDRGTLYAFNPDGTILWRRNLGAPIRVAPVLALVPTDFGPVPVLYVAASNRMLYAFVETTPVRFPPGTGTGGGTGSW